MMRSGEDDEVPNPNCCLLLNFFLLFGASYILGVIFLHYSASIVSWSMVPLACLLFTSLASNRASGFCGPHPHTCALEGHEEAGLVSADCCNRNGLAGMQWSVWVPMWTFNSENVPLHRHTQHWFYSQAVPKQNSCIPLIELCASIIYSTPFHLYFYRNSFSDNNETDQKLLIAVY